MKRMLLLCCATLCGALWAKPQITDIPSRSDLVVVVRDSHKYNQQQLEAGRKKVQRKARKEKEERDRKTRVVIYCNICECEREDNKRSAMEWQRNSKTVEEANEERYAKAFVESGQGDYGGSSRLGATECDYCPHLPSFHRIVEQ